MPTATVSPEVKSKSVIQELEVKLLEAIRSGNKSLEKETRKEITRLNKPEAVFKPSVEKSEYNGQPMLRLKTHDGFEKFPFQFGLKKAILILALYPEIKKFVEEHAK